MFLLCANKWVLTHLKIMLQTNYSLKNRIYIYIYIYICVCVCVSEEMSWIWLNVRRKGKMEKNYVWWFVTCRCILTSIFFGMQNCFIEIILVWEIIMIDKFWFNLKSSSGLVGLAMWKNGLILVDMLKNSITWHDAIWIYQPISICFFT